MKTIYVKDFTEFPGPRYIRLGPNSGEEYRTNYLIPALKESDEEICVNLDGTMGYGSSFLEEAFGGLVRENIPESTVLKLVGNIVSKEDPSLIDEVSTYVNDAITTKNK
jgi:hypothetical protein